MERSIDNRGSSSSSARDTGDVVTATAGPGVASEGVAGIEAMVLALRDDCAANREAVVADRG